jgi:hypothetical protein
MNPFTLHVLLVHTTAGSQSGSRAILDPNRQRLKALGERLVAEKPAEADVTFSIVEAEGCTPTLATLIANL